MPHPCPGLLDQALAQLRTWPPGSLVAVYAYGSVPQGGVDQWSDLDLCAVHASTEAGLAACREWMQWAYDTFAFRVDPVGISEDDLGRDAPWEVATILHSLKAHSRLVLGTEVAPQIAEPSSRKLCLNVGQLALLAVRRLYGLQREEPIPGPLPALHARGDVSAPMGNLAWATYTAAVQLLRALVLVERGTLCESKSELYDALSEVEGTALRSPAVLARSVRATLPRFGPLETIPRDLQRLIGSIPALASRLLRGLAIRGIEDPSYEPNGRPRYSPGGVFVG